MKLTIKTLQQSTFKVDIEPDKTVKDLKEQIETEQGKDYPFAAQKLIYSGKILTDESKLTEYEFDEKKFVVLMITRPPPVAKPVEPAPATTSKKVDDKAKSSTSDQDNKTKTTTSSVTQPSPTRTTTTTTTASNTTTTNNPSTATQADNPNRQARPSSGLLQAAMNEASALSMGGGEPNASAARLANLMMQPQFRQMQDLIQQSPHLLSSTIEALAASDPEMYSFISENPDVFVNALNHAPLAGSRTHSSRGSTTGQQQSRAPGDGAPAAGGRQQPVVDQLLGNVSEHDKEAIERLKELGFSEYLAVQAYMACDKDEQMAANLLLQMD